MSRCLDDVFDIQDAILVLERLNLDTPLLNEEGTEEAIASKSAVLTNLYVQLESHIETDIQECTEEEVQKIYNKKFLYDYDIIDKVRSRDDNE